MCEESEVSWMKPTTDIQDEILSNKEKKTEKKRVIYEGFDPLRDHWNEI